jgi:toxin ParE1/3/4
VAAGKPNYRIGPAAREDLRQAAIWYEDEREGLGVRFADEVRRAISLIVSSPQRWPVRDGTRRYVLRRFPYTIAYRTDASAVVIVAIAHHRLDPGSWTDR